MRLVGSAACAVAGLLVVTACGLPRFMKADNRDCYYSLTWHHTSYFEPGTDGSAPASRTPDPGRRLGSGYVPQCDGDDSGAEATVLAVPGVSPEVAVFSRVVNDPHPTLVIRKGHPTPKVLLGP